MLKPNGTKCWMRSGDTTTSNAGTRIVDVTEGAMVQVRSASVTLTANGIVRAHRIALPVKAGMQMIANITPGATTLNGLGLTSASGFVATGTAATSDRVDILASDLIASAPGYRTLNFLNSGGSARWVDAAMTDVSNDPLVGSMRSIMINSTNSKPSFAVPLSWRP